MPDDRFTAADLDALAEEYHCEGVEFGNLGQAQQSESAYHLSLMLTEGAEAKRMVARVRAEIAKIEDYKGAWGMAGSPLHGAGMAEGAKYVVARMRDALLTGSEAVK